MQVVAQHPLGLQSLWDARLHNGRSVGGEVEERLFTTWKIRTEGQTQRVIDYVWCVSSTLKLRWTIHAAVYSCYCAGSTYK